MAHMVVVGDVVRKRKIKFFYKFLAFEARLSFH